MSEEQKVYPAEIAVKEEKYLQKMSPADIKEQMDEVRQLYKDVMIKDVHYGKVPGTDKDILLKAGAEKLMEMFRLRPVIKEHITKDLGNGHREEIIIISIYKISTNAYWGDGVGSCSTMEKKYRYRWTSASVPTQAIQEQLKSAGLGKFVKDKQGKWIWLVRSENPDIAETWNTVLKMSEKRAINSAVMKTTGVSDMFTQDLEDGSPDDSTMEDRPLETAMEPPKQPANAAPAPQPAAPASKEMPKATETAITPILGITEKTGTTNGKSWHLYFISGDGLTFTTFDKTLADFARLLFPNGTQAKIEYIPTPKGNNLLSIKENIIDVEGVPF